MADSLSSLKEEAQRAVSALPKKEQRMLIKELNLGGGFSVGSFEVSWNPFTGDPSMQMPLLVIGGLILILFVMIIGLILAALNGKPVNEQFFSLVTAIIGYLAGIITPKPSKTKVETKDEVE